MLQQTSVLFQVAHCCGGGKLHRYIGWHFWKATAQSRQQFRQAAQGYWEAYRTRLQEPSHNVYTASLAR